LALKHQTHIPSFPLKEIKLEVEVEVEASDDSKIGAKVYVLSGELAAKARTSATQKVTLVLGVESTLMLGDEEKQESPEHVSLLSGDGQSTQ
jgi:hypothetical protein